MELHRLGGMTSCLPACLVSVVRPPFDLYKYIGHLSELCTHKKVRYVMATSAATAARQACAELLADGIATNCDLASPHDVGDGRKMSTSVLSRLSQIERQHSKFTTSSYLSYEYHIDV